MSTFNLNFTSIFFKFRPFAAPGKCRPVRPAPPAPPSLRHCVSSPSEILGRSPAENRFRCILSLKKTNLVMTNLILFVIFIAHIYSQIYKAISFSRSLGGGGYRPLRPPSFYASASETLSRFRRELKTLIVRSSRRFDKYSGPPPLIICLFPQNSLCWTSCLSCCCTGARVWDDLPSNVTSSVSQSQSSLLLTFKHRLKCTYSVAYPGL